MSIAVADSKTGRKKLAPRIARQQHERRVRFWRVFTVAAFFAIALSGNLFIGAMVVQKNFGDVLTFDKLFSWTKPAEVAPTAQVRRPLLDGTFCRSIVFDNNTAQSISDKVERCDVLRNQPRGKTRTQFNWGGR